MRRILGTFSFLAIALTCGAQSGAETKNVWDSLTGFPAYVGMQTYHLPVVASVMGKPYVFFEIYVLNAYESAIDVSQLATYANGKRVEALRGKDLESSMQPVGRLSAAPPSHTIAAAETAVFFVALPFASVRDVPHLIQNELTLSVRKAGAHVFTVKQAVLRVNFESANRDRAAAARQRMVRGQRPGKRVDPPPHHFLFQRPAVPSASVLRSIGSRASSTAGISSFSTGTPRKIATGIAGTSRSTPLATEWSSAKRWIFPRKRSQPAPGGEGDAEHDRRKLPRDRSRLRAVPRFTHICGRTARPSR